MARFYSKENIPLQVVMELRRLGHDVLTSRDAGNANAAVPDSEVLAFAAAEDRVLLSHNRRHFLRLHLLRIDDYAGMVLCTFDPDFRSLAERIGEAVKSAPAELPRIINVCPLWGRGFRIWEPITNPPSEKRRLIAANRLHFYNELTHINF